MKNIYKKNLNKGRFVNSTDKKVVVIDKLEVRFETSKNLNDITDINDNLSLLEVTKTDAININRQLGRQYKRCSVVMFKKVVVANMFYTKKIDNEIKGILVFRNGTFYRNFDSYFKELITSDVLQFDVIKINRLDIAFDVNNKSYFKELHKNYTSYRNEKIYLLNGTEFIEIKPKKSYYLGAKRFVQIYDKTLELKNGNKYYIKDFYKVNQFDEKKGITRIELRLTKSKVGFISRLVDKVDLLKIIDTNYIGNIVKHILDEKLWLVHRDNANRSRRTKKRLLSIDYGSYEKVVNFSESTRDKGANPNVMKSILKKLIFEWQNDTDNGTDCQLYRKIREKIVIFKLTDWYNNYIKSKFFISEYNNYVDLYC